MRLSFWGTSSSRHPAGALYLDPHWGTSVSRPPIMNPSQLAKPAYTPDGYARVLNAVNVGGTNDYYRNRCLSVTTDVSDSV